MRKALSRLYGLKESVALKVISLSLMAFLLSAEARATDSSYTDSQIADAIYLAEGGTKANSPFGILSVSCEGYNACRQICLNTIRNNRKRYAEYGYKQYNTFLEFLASRYCPIGAKNDPKGLNKNWLKNVLYFLQRRGNG